MLSKDFLLFLLNSTLRTAPNILSLSSTGMLLISSKGHDDWMFYIFELLLWPILGEYHGGWYEVDLSEVDMALLN